MDQALKQRMVGATVLIALGVIFLPIFIGGSNDPEVTIQNDEFLIPPQPQIANGNNEPGRRLPLVRPSQVTPPPANNDNGVDLSSGDIRLPLPDEAMPQNDAAASGQGDDSSSNLTVDAGSLVSTDNAANNDAGTSEPSTPIQNQTPDDPPVTQTVAVVAPPPINEDSSPAVSSSSGNTANISNRWRVQVASLGNPDNATRLINQIESLGFPAQSQVITSNGNSLHRVLAGPFSNEAEANVAVTGIRGADGRLNPQVLSPDGADQPATDNTSTTTTSAASAAGGLDRYAVQAGVFSSAENAENLVQRLNNAGYAAYSERVDGNGQALFRVRIGPLLSDSDADNIATRIERDLGVRGIVVDYPQ